jgi:hypothetical protein
LTKGCEESKIMMKKKKKTMMEDNFDGSSNLKFLEEKTPEEELLWLIQKGLPRDNYK